MTQGRYIAGGNKKMSISTVFKVHQFYQKNPQTIEVQERRNILKFFLNTKKDDRRTSFFLKFDQEHFLNVLN